MTPTELARRWRSDADVLERCGADQLAKANRTHADELDAAIRSVNDDALSLADASRESGLSLDRLRHKVASGEIPNAGRKGKPRIRRGDLPIKRKARNGRFDAQAAARAVLKVSRNG